MRALWLTDTHTTFSFLWKKYSLVKYIKNKKVDAVIITGDISNGLFVDYILYYLASHLRNIEIYFVIGNHDLWFRDIEDVYDDLRKLTETYKNLHWLTEKDAIELTKDVAIIGNDGWYSCRVDNDFEYKFTFDWMLINDFRKMKSMEERIEAFKQKSLESAKDIEGKLINAIDAGYKTIFLATHVPPFKETNMNTGWFAETRNAYDTNDYMGESIKKIMSKHPEKNLICLSGHTHYNVSAKISNNIECRTNKANYFSVRFANEELINI